MANRRMFSLKIIDTDLFLDMPSSSQLLYFHLSMRADDDGFVSSPKKIIKMVNCSDDDFRILLAKNFVIPFESGICVIKHWKIHNYIQSDRYSKTIYQKEKSMLTDNEGVYGVEGSDTKCIQNVSKVDTQVRLGKDRLELGKDNIGPEKKVDKTTRGFDIVIDNYTSNDILKTTLFEFIKMRKANKKIMTDRSLTLLLTNLNKLATNDIDKIAILNQSIEKCWTGVFAISTQQNYKGKADKFNNYEQRPDAVETYERLAAAQEQKDEPETFDMSNSLKKIRSK